MMQRVLYSVVFRQDLLVHKGDYLDSVQGTSLKGQFHKMQPLSSLLCMSQLTLPRGAADPGSGAFFTSRSGSGMEKIGIWDEHPARVIISTA